MENRSRPEAFETDFQYGTSKNPYWFKLKDPTPDLKSLSYLDHATEAHRGNWRSQFLQYSVTSSSLQQGTPPAPLHVEIGCNAGHVVIEWAAKNPDHRYIGLDWKVKQIYRLSEKIRDRKLKNILGFRANAERLHHMFAPGEIDFLYLYFPDPWPKKSQKKNRTADQDWLRRIAPTLKTGGVFHIKTDHAEYFDFMLQEISSCLDLFDPFEKTFDLHADNPNRHALKIPEVTLFERLFIKDGLPIHSIKLKKR